jgi:hypothetical protein
VFNAAIAASRPPSAANGGGASRAIGGVFRTAAYGSRSLAITAKPRCFANRATTPLPAKASRNVPRAGSTPVAASASPISPSRRRLLPRYGTS